MRKTLINVKFQKTCLYYRILFNINLIMAKQYKNILPAKYYRDHLIHEIRPDGRDLMKFRQILINVGSLNSADGSAVIKIGETTIVCGIKAELTQPKAEEPNKGFLIPNVELPPLCSPKFRPGPPSDQAQVTSRLVADIIENSKCIDLTELCIHPDRLAWVLYCDIICLNHDGALTDACVTALISALKTVTLPEVEYNPEIDKKIVKENSRKSLNIKSIPVSCTYAIFDDTTMGTSIVVVDPTSEEENLCTGIITITVCGNDLCSVHKPGGSPLNDKEIDECIKQTKKRSAKINELLDTVLAVKKDKTLS